MDGHCFQSDPYELLARVHVGHPGWTGLELSANCDQIQEGPTMAINPPKRQAPKTESPVIHWLLDSDPAIRWQVMRDLISSPAEQVAADRARVATEGAGARLLSLQASDGRWGGAAWNGGWNSTEMIVMNSIR